MEITVFNEEQEKAVYELFRTIEEKEGRIRELEYDLEGITDDRDGIYEMYEEALADLHEMRKESEHFEDLWQEQVGLVEILERELYDARQKINMLELELQVAHLKAENNELRRQQGSLPYIEINRWNNTKAPSDWPFGPNITCDCTKGGK